jgi:hypothetical protein
VLVHRLSLVSATLARFQFPNGVFVEIVASPDGSVPAPDNPNLVEVGRVEVRPPALPSVQRPLEVLDPPACGGSPTTASDAILGPACTADEVYDIPAAMETGPPSLPTGTGEPEGALCAAPPKAKSSWYRGFKTGMWAAMGEGISYLLSGLTDLHLPPGVGLAAGAGLAALGSGLHNWQQNRKQT